MVKSNTEIYKEHIRYNVIRPLERMMARSQWQEDMSYSSMDYRVSKDSVYRSVLHELMMPYYEKYLFGDIRLCKANMESIRLRMKDIIADDDLFGHWASEQDLVASAEGWGDNMKRIPETKRIYQYFYVLEALLQKDCRQGWRALSEKLKEMLFQSEVYSDYKTDEVLCVLHAFTMIMQQEWPKGKKQEQMELLRTNWLFMKYYYSVMTRHIVGVKWTKFYDVRFCVNLGGNSSPRLSDELCHT